MKNSMLAARLGLTKVATKKSSPVAKPVVGPGKYQGKDAAEGHIGLDAHHDAFSKAHKAGKHDEARSHALNYAKTSTQIGQSMTQPPNPATGSSGTKPPAGMLGGMKAPAASGAKQPKGMTSDVIRDKGF